MTDLDQVLAYCELRERQLLERVKHIYKMTGRKVTLIGWSMGGVFANTLAQTHPQWIARVITLGAPLGNPKHTSTWNLLKWMNRSRVPEEMQNVNAWVDRKNRAGTRQVFSTVIYSDRDGAVSEAAAVIENEPLVENIKVQSSHIGYVHNPLVYWVIAERLAQDPEQPKPFDISMQPPKIQQHFVY